MKYKKPKSSKQYKFGDFMKDVVRGYVDYSTAPIEGILGKDVFDTGNYDSKAIENIANIGGQVNTQAANLLMNSAAPGSSQVVNNVGNQVGQNITQPIMMSNGGELINYNNGGTHEQNPNGGIPVGPNALVEEGETSANDYVFSDRLKVNKTLAKEFSLPKKAIGKSFADVSKMISEQEYSSDAIGKRTFKKETDNLRKAQEAFKQVHNKSNNTNQFANGGDLTELQILQLSEKYTPEQIEGIVEGFRKDQIDPASLDPETLNNLISGYASNHIKLPADDPNNRNVFSTPGSGYVQNPEAITNNSLPVEGVEHISNPYLQGRFNVGGRQAMTPPLSEAQIKGRQAVDEYRNVRNSNRTTSNTSNTSNPVVRSQQPLPSNNTPSTSPQVSNKTNTLLPTEGFNVEDQDNLIGTPEEITFNKNSNSNSNSSNSNLNKYATAARFAPVGSSLVNMGRLMNNKPVAKDINMFNTNESFDPNLLDAEQIKRNIESQGEAVRNNIGQIAGGNSGATRASLIASQLGTDQSVANANIQVDSINNQELARVQNANFQQSAMNQRNRMATQQMNDQDQGVYDQLMMDQIANVGNNIGGVGNDALNREMVSNMPMDYFMNVFGQVNKKK